MIEYSGSSFSFSRLDKYEKLIFAGIAVGILLHPTIYASNTPKLLMREIDDTLHSYKPLCKNICQNLAKTSFLHFSKVIKRDKEISYTTFFNHKKILIYSHMHMFFGRGPEFLRINHSNLCKVIRKPQSRFAFYKIPGFYFPDD